MNELKKGCADKSAQPFLINTSLRLLYCGYLHKKHRYKLIESSLDLLPHIQAVTLVMKYYPLVADHLEPDHLMEQLDWLVLLFVELRQYGSELTGKLICPHH